MKYESVHVKVLNTFMYCTNVEGKFGFMYIESVELCTLSGRAMKTKGGGSSTRNAYDGGGDGQSFL